MDPDLCPVLAEVAIDGDAPQRKVQDVSLQNTLSDTVRAHPQKINLFIHMYHVSVYIFSLSQFEL